MRLTISRCLVFAMAAALLGLTACAPKSDPEPFPENTSGSASSEAVAKEYADKAAGDTEAAGEAKPAEGDKTAENTENVPAGTSEAAPAEDKGGKTEAEAKKEGSEVKQEGSEAKADEVKKVNGTLGSV